MQGVYDSKNVSMFCQRARNMLMFMHRFGLSFRKGDESMSEKRRDSKNRILRDGETERPDGRYRFAYWDLNKQRKYVYSWKLDKNDPTPVGTRRYQRYAEHLYSRHRRGCEGRVCTCDGSVMSVSSLIFCHRSGFFKFTPILPHFFRILVPKIRG